MLPGLRGVTGDGRAGAPEARQATAVASEDESVDPQSLLGSGETSKLASRGGTKPGPQGGRAPASEAVSGTGT